MLRCWMPGKWANTNERANNKLLDFTHYDRLNSKARNMFSKFFLLFSVIFVYFAGFSASARETFRSISFSLRCNFRCLWHFSALRFTVWIEVTIIGVLARIRDSYPLNQWSELRLLTLLPLRSPLSPPDTQYLNQSRPTHTTGSTFFFANHSEFRLHGNNEK